MDVTFTNVLEGARQYFQGLPTATSSTAGPNYSNSSETVLLNNETDQASELPPSSAGYWPPQQQETAARPPAREQTPQRPPSESSKPVNIDHGRSQTMNHYQGNYQEPQQMFQFPRPQTNVYPSHVIQNSTYHQPASPQQPRLPSRQEHMITPPSSSTQSYHQMQNSGQASQGYYNYQQQPPQQQQQRSYYPVPSQAKTQAVLSNNSAYKVASSQPHSQSSQENAYYKHLYSPHVQNAPQQQQNQYNSNSKLAQHPHSVQQAENPKLDRSNSSQNQTASQGYRTTHNLPPIASLSLINYHSSRNSNKEVVRTTSVTKARTNIPPSNSVMNNQIAQSAPKVTSSSASIVQTQPHSVRMSNNSYAMDSMQHNYRSSNSQYSNQNSQNTNTNNNYHQYSTATTTTQNYSQVIMTTSNSSPTTYPTVQQNQSSSVTQQHYYPQQSNELQSHEMQQQQQQQQQRSHHQSSNILPQQQSSSNNSQAVGERNPAGMKQKRESPLDLSVKTVRTPADSTLDDVEQDARSKYFINNRAPANSSISTHNYPTYDVYPNSFQRGLSTRPSQVPSASAPKVEFHPNFNVSTYPQHNNYRRNPIQTVPDKNVNCQQRIANYQQQSNQQQNVNAARYPTVSVPTSAHVNSYIQSSPQQPKRTVENSPRIDFPPPGHGHKTSALYPVPTHDMQKKRPADTAPSSIIPNKMSKVDTWRLNIDQQIEQRLSSYKQQQQQQQTGSSKHNTNNKTSPLVNGNYPTISQERPKEVIHNAYQRQYNQTMYQPQSNQYIHSQNTHNQTYVPSVGAHQYPGYGAYASQQNSYPPPNLPRTNSNSSLATVGGNKNNVGGADKRVLSLLRNSLEIKEAQKKLELEQQMHLHKHSRLDVQHPSTDVQAPLQPKPGFTSRHNVSPFTPTNFPEGNNTLTSMYKLQIPKAIDSVNFESETNKYLGHNSDTIISNHVNPNGDLDGLAAFLAARIRTKAELKQVGPSHNQNICNNNLQGLIENQLKTPMKQDHNFVMNNSSVSPPKLNKERQSFPPRRRLFSRPEDDSGNSTGNNNIPLRDKSGLRSSSETSVFDFPDSDSEGEMPVLERQTLEEMRRDRRTSSTKQLCEVKSESRPVTPSDDIFTQACDSFMEQLKSGSGKKRGRRKKMEPDVLAKLETVTKERPLDLEVTIKKEVEDEVSTVKDNEQVTKILTNVKSEVIDDEDSDVPLIKCKNSTVIKEENKKSPSKNKTTISKHLSSSLNDISSRDFEEPQSKEIEHVTPTKKGDNFVLKDVASVQPRPAKKPNFGDGSHFGPGWEEEVYKYKKSLRMPPSLIQVTRPPHYHRLSTSLPDLDPCPNSPTPSLLADNNEYSKTKLSKIKSECLDSDEESNYSFNIFGNKHNYDSEGGSSIKSLPNTIKESSNILDKLLERCGGRKKRKYKRKDDIHPRIVPKADKVVELLATPVKLETDKTKSKDSSPVALGFRKKTIANFKDVFLGNNKEVQARTRKSRMKKQKISIKEVFGEDRPASAPPVTCVNHIKIKEEVPSVDDVVVVKKEADPKEALKNKLLNRGRKENNLLKSLADKKIKTELLEDIERDEPDDDEYSNKGDIDCKSETPSIDGDEGSVSGKKRSKFRNIRRKFSSGFDYIRKKKKSVKKEGQENDPNVKPRRRGGQFSKSNSGSVQDIQKEIKGWVLNKGIGETTLHRSCRLGYEDITAFCLEKMECSPSPKDNAGYTPLHEACARGHLTIAKMLLLYGANASESARGGIRPLHEAAESGNVELVRLLLSYGADPLLTTYSGLSPLQMATEETTIKLLERHIDDIQGKTGPHWDFAGPAADFDLKETGFDVLADDPEPDAVSEEEDEIDFEMSDSLLPNLYTLRGESSNDRWILLQDLSSLLKIKSRDALLRQICPPATSTSPVTFKSVLRELKMSDFLEQAHCCQFLNTGEKINTRASKIALVKYTDKVRELLNVEQVTISVR